MPPPYFPLRWESTGDQWWYVSPIDWAAANGLYDLVKELLYLDNNLLIKLTSLRRIRRLETVWDDEEQFADVARCRSQVARQLLDECETRKGYNSLIRAGYGGWLLYTAASAGDVSFAKALLGRDPVLVFGEGEYGVTDIFYAAARSKNLEVFRILLDFSLSPRTNHCNGGELVYQLGQNEVPSALKYEMINRAVHASARGGNLEILKELIGDGSDALVYKDQQGFTILHSAAGRGQVEVVKDILASYDITTVTDNLGNTGLHVAAYRGYGAMVEVLALACPVLTTLANKFGDTFLHMAVAGFRTPVFKRLDCQIELMKQLLSGRLMNIRDIINVRNNDGRTALHVAVAENIQSSLVELLMTVPSISLNIRDADGMTPLDLLKQRPRSASSKILIKQLISAGGISNFHDYKATRNAFVSHLWMQGIGSSPGTTFKIPDAEIFLYTGTENVSFDASWDPSSTELSRYSGELSQVDSDTKLNSVHNNKKSIHGSHATGRLKILLQWRRKKEKESSGTKSRVENSLDSYKIKQNFKDNPISLRQRFSKSSSLPNNKRTLAVDSSLPPSPSSKKNFIAGLMQGVIPQTTSFLSGSPSSPFSRSSTSSPGSPDKEKSAHIESDITGPSKLFWSPRNGASPGSTRKVTSFNLKLMNQYFCFGAQGLDVDLEDTESRTRSNQSYKRSST